MKYIDTEDLGCVNMNNILDQFKFNIFKNILRLLCAPIIRKFVEQSKKKNINGGSWHGVSWVC